MSGPMGREPLTLAEAEDLVDEAVAFPDTMEDLLVNLIREPPPYFAGMQMIIAGLETMKHSEHQCDDCDNPACFGRPQHQQYLRETVLEEMPALEAAVNSMKKELALFIYRYHNCECERCQTKEKKDAAKFN